VLAFSEKILLASSILISKSVIILVRPVHGPGDHGPGWAEESMGQHTVY